MSRQIAEDIKVLGVAHQKKGKVYTKRYLDSKKRLSELGLIENNLKTKTPNESDALKWAEGNMRGFAAPEVIRKALSKGVDDIIMAPNVINRPLWMSDPRLAVFAQLKGFMYAFGLKVGTRFWREIIKPLGKGRVPINESLKFLNNIKNIINIPIITKPRVKI